MALDYYRDRPYTGARLVLLVSDGGADIAGEDREVLEDLFRAERASLVWVYTRGAREDSVIALEDDDSLSQSLSMHRFFTDAEMPYQVFEAADAAALQTAIAKVGRMTNLPTRYQQRLPRRDLSAPLFGAALVALLLLIAARTYEVTAWPVR